MAGLFKNFSEDKPEEVFAYLAPRLQKLDEVLGRGNYMMIGAYVRDCYLLETQLEPYRSTQDYGMKYMAIKMLRTSTNCWRLE